MLFGRFHGAVIVLALLGALGLATAPGRASAQQKPASGYFAVAKDTPADVFTVTDQVLVKDPPRFGANVHFGGYSHWSPTPCQNILNYTAGMEPIVLRHIITMRDPEGSTPTEIRNVNNNGISRYGLFPAGTFDGGTLQHYRLKDGYYELIHRTTVKKWDARTRWEVGYKEMFKKPEKIILADPGPVAQEGDIVVVTVARGDKPFPDVKEASLFKYGVFGPSAPGVKLFMDSSQKCPEGGSTASMRITLPGSKKTPVGPFQWWFSPKNAHMPADGKMIKVHIWARQEGMPTGKVELQLGSLLTKELKVTDRWQKFEFEFKMDRSKVKRLSKLLIGSTEKGTLWIDNFYICQADMPPFAIRPYILKALKEYRPGCLRIWQGLGRPTLEAWLADWQTEPRSSLRGTNGFNLNRALELCQAVGTDPWLIIQPFFTDEEVAHLMEYLGAPADVGYGKRRAADGHPEPWTGVFNNIYLECCNEPWNAIFVPRAWPGHPEEYSAVANREFRLVKKSPYYKAEVFRCVAGGWSAGASWNAKVAELCTEADVLDVANYYGGSDGVTVVGKNDEELFQGNLLYVPHLVAPKMESAVAVRDAARARRPGGRFDLANYEGGPGYAQPNTGKEFFEDSEKIGKSMALGLVSLDCYLYLQSLGFGHLNYFQFRCGPRWASHTDPVRMIPYPSWIALMMRNLYCSGDMTKVEPTSVKLVDIPTRMAAQITWNGKKVKKRVRGRSGIQLVVCYSYRDGKKHMFVLLNRSLDEPRKVVLNLPYDPKPEAKLYILTSKDPRTDNRSAYNVKMREETRKDFNRTYSFTLPPCAVYLFVNEQR